MVRSALFLVGLCAASAASAVVGGASPTGFKVTHEVTVAASPATVWRALGRVGRWWDPEHTWSGEARNMRAKSLTFLAGADAAGIVLGARVPSILTSLADSLSARMASCAVAALVAAARRKSGKAIA